MDRLCAHFELFWPEQVEEMGAEYREIIESGVKRAAEFGLDTEQTVARYINLWFIWGVAFEDEPEFEWAMEILTDTSRNPEVKIRQLNWRTQQDLEMNDRLEK